MGVLGGLRDVSGSSKYHGAPGVLRGFQGCSKGCKLRFVRFAEVSEVSRGSEALLGVCRRIISTDL